MTIEDLKKCVRENRYEISFHAQKERCEENITLPDIERAILRGEIIEEYSEDPRGPSLLISGYSGRRPIHIVCGVLPNRWLRIITVYIPRPPKWATPRQRRK